MAVPFTILQRAPHTASPPIHQEIKHVCPQDRLCQAQRQGCWNYGAWTSSPGLLDSLHDKKNKVHKMVRLCLAQSVEMENILRSHLPADGFLALPRDAADKFTEATCAMASLTVQLRDHFATETSHKIFTVTAKTHMLLHIALLSHIIHPRLTWCFSGEDYMHRVQRLVASCCTGRPLFSRTMESVSSHYRLGLHLGFDNIEKKVVEI